MYRICCFVLAAVFLMTSCKDDPHKPEDLISEPLYIELLTDLFLNEKMVEMRSLVEKEDSLRNVLFDHYDVTREQFERSHEYYQRQTDRQLARIDSVQSIMRSERDSLESLRNEINAAKRKERERQLQTASEEAETNEENSETIEDSEEI